jgi:hypothetical protein
MRRIILVPCGYHIIKAPVADTACDILNRRVKQYSDGTGVKMPAIVTFPSCPIKSMTTEDVLTTYA